jgi:hypothetical protein
MRALGIIVALAACHAAEPPRAVPPPPPPAPCARAADNLVATMLARLPAEGAPTEQADALRNLIRQRCERDAWSAEATRCLIAIQRTEDAERCAALLTEDQQAQLVRDQAAQGAGRTAPPPASGPAETRPIGFSHDLPPRVW